ncbi:fused MFS/spermidine synthase [Marinospirillum sp.]|uniref:fused MFS/spermidine synthase n=1 Tax=Marinospirillum sp. TaxID=2183934 RepID=UPI00384AB9A4
MPRYIFILIGLIFFLSGGLALIYEVTWVRILSPELGADALAVTTLVSVFLGGLAAGAYFSGHLANRLARPLKIYGYLEALLALYALLSPSILNSLLPLFGFLGSQAPENIWLLSFFRFLVSSLLLLPPTLLMGATLPLLARFAAKQSENTAATTSFFYALNTLGAVVGCLAAGFVLLPLMGNSSTLQLAAVINLGMALGLLLLSRNHERSGSSFQESKSSLPVSSTEQRSFLPLITLAVTLSGMAGLICQLAWTRVLVLIVGASAYAFTSVLAVFLLGLGGGALTASLLLKYWQRGRVFGFSILALVTGLAVYASSFVLTQLPELFLGLFNTQTASSLFGQFKINMGIATSLLLLPSWLLGMLFPFALHLVIAQRARAAQQTGSLYFWNTLGTILGSTGAGFILIPLLGLVTSLLLAASLLVMAGLLVLLPYIRQPKGYLPLLVSINFLMAAFYFAPGWNRALMVSGVSEYAEIYAEISKEYSLAEYLEESTELLFYQDGLTATISVERNRLLEQDNIYIATNGKVDGSSQLDMPTQKLIAHLPSILHPAPLEVAVIGMGTGVTAGSASLHPATKKVTVVEIEPAMVEAARFFSDYNHQFHQQDKADIRITDGRLHLYLHPRQYDVILSEPSNPWITGIASLFTQEHYQLGAKALKSGGIYAQWLQIYDLPPQQVHSILATFQSVFPYTLVAFTLAEADLLLIGSQQPLDLDPERLDRRMQPPQVAADLAEEPIKIKTLHQLLAHIWLTEEELEPLIAQAQLHRDDHPFLMYQAPLNRYLQTQEENSRILAEVARGILPLIRRQGYTLNQLQLDQAYQEQLPDYLPAFYKN